MFFKRKNCPKRCTERVIHRLLRFHIEMWSPWTIEYRKLSVVWSEDIPQGSKKHWIEVIFRLIPSLPQYGYKSVLSREIRENEGVLEDQNKYYCYNYKHLPYMRQKTNATAFTGLKLSSICVWNLTFSLVKVLRSIGQNAGGFLESNLNKLLRMSVPYFIKERCLQITYLRIGSRQDSQNRCPQSLVWTGSRKASWQIGHK